jgi:NADH dehydrogenase [ubiquinone] 1 alpha subcomplex assembly factor 3
MTMKAPSVTLLRVLRSSLRSHASSKSLHSYSHTSSICLTQRAIVHRRQHCFSTQAYQYAHVPASKDRGPASTEETQTDFGVMDMLSNMPPPTSAIDACLDNGFHFDNGLKIDDGSGCLLVGGEVFAWRPWTLSKETEHKRKSMINKKGQWDVDSQVWGLLDLVWPKPGMLLYQPVFLLKLIACRYLDPWTWRVCISNFTRNKEKD